MKLNRLLVSSALISIFALTQADASKQYYEYKAKAKPAKGLGFFGDHAYVCVKRKKKKHHHMRTIRNYGCYSQSNWTTSGGRTTARYFVRKTSKSKKRFEGAKCTTWHPDCSVHGWNYLNVGVCHQAANMFLYGASRYAQIGHSTRGYTSGFNSRALFGPYGHTWRACRKSCYHE